MKKNWKLLIGILFLAGGFGNVTSDIGAAAFGIIVGATLIFWWTDGRKRQSHEELKYQEILAERQQEEQAYQEALAKRQQEESIKQTLSISFVFTFLISSLYLVAILKGMEELPPNTFPETIEIIQQVGWGRLFLVSLMGIEMLFFVVIFIPVIIVSFLNILVIFVEFLKSPAFRKKN